MCPGLSADSRKTAIISKELARLNIDVACLQETRLADSGSLMERDNTFFWQGLSQDEPRQYSVGFAVRNSLVATTETTSGGSSRILALRIKTSVGFVNIISAYAPTLSSIPEAKDQLILRGSAGNIIQNHKLGPTGKHGLPASLLIQQLLQWFGHAHGMEPDCLTGDILYGELREGVIKRDLRSALIDTSAWEDIAKHRGTRRQSVKAGVSKAEPNTTVQATCKRAARKERTASARDSTRHV